MVFNIQSIAIEITLMDLLLSAHYRHVIIPLQAVTEESKLVEADRNTVFAPTGCEDRVIAFGFTY